MVRVAWVGINGVYEVDDGWIVALELVAWSRAEFEDFASSGVDQGLDTGCVFIRDKAVGCGMRVSMFVRGWVEDVEVTIRDEKFRCGGVSNSLGIRK